MPKEIVKPHYLRVDKHLLPKLGQNKEKAKTKLSHIFWSLERGSQED